MAKPAWHEDFLVCYPAIIERLKGIQCIKKVFEAKELNELSANESIVPLDGAAYVLFDSIEPLSERGVRENTLQIGFSIILAKQQYTPQPKIDGLGQTLAAVYKAFNGFDPTNDEGRALVSTPFRAAKPKPILFRNSVGLFPMRFVSEVVVMADD